MVSIGRKAKRVKKRMNSSSSGVLLQERRAGVNLHAQEIGVDAPQSFSCESKRRTKRKK